MVRNHEHVGIHQRNLYRLWDMAVSYLYQEIMPVSSILVICIWSPIRPPAGDRTDLCQDLGSLYISTAATRPRGTGHDLVTTDCIVSGHHQHCLLSEKLLLSVPDALNKDQQFMHNFETYMVNNVDLKPYN